MKLLVIPERMREQAIDLRQICIAGLAWTYPAILEVIQYVADHEHAILGGDVYAIDSRGPVATGDTWYAEPCEGTSRADFVNLGAARAREYVETYHSRNGERFLYSIVAGLAELDCRPKK